MNKLFMLINRRDEMIAGKFGDNMLEELNYPENRDWYAKNISPLDWTIVAEATKLTGKNYKNVGEVYRCSEIAKLYQQQNNGGSENQADCLFDDIFDKRIEITDAVKNNIRNKKASGNVRLAEGMYRTDAEQEKYIKESLERELP